MARTAKRTPEVIELVLERIKQGEYERKALPSTRALAEELGVSKFTIYRAYCAAKEKGFVKCSGRTWVATGNGNSRSLEVAFIVPVADVPTSFLWFSSLDELMEGHRGRAHLVDYSGPSDSRLIRALQGNYDVIFFNPPHGPMPPLLERLLRKRRGTVVTLYQDLPKLGIWGIDNMPVEAVDLLIYHLASKGVREIHLVGSQSVLGRQEQLVAQWKRCLSAVQATGDEFCPAENEANLLEAAARQTRALLARHPRPASIVFCDLPSALGGYRVLWEAGLVPGRDLLVAGLVCEPEAAYLTPSLTSILAPPRTTVLEEVCQEILAGKGAERRDWSKRALARVQLLEGESSRPSSMSSRSGALA
jgi:DNA-binding LacI/PurR family transcriptional regulator